MKSGKNHGYSKTPVYRSWVSIKARCNNKNNHAYKWYGARGIKVCDRWNSFINFLDDMGERPKGKSLDRIDNNGNYEPGNCRWATSKQQSENRRNNVYVEYSGKRLLLKEWAIQIGIKYKTLHLRYVKGLRPPELFQPTYTKEKPINQFTTEGEYVGSYDSIKQASKETGLRHSGISNVVRGARHTCGGYVWRFASYE